jgi:hypothetical protein
MDQLAPNTKEQAVGYDARDYRDDFATLWPEKRRQEFLYRLDVRKVLSVDPRVWPSVFAALKQPPPSHQESVQELWASENAVRSALSASVLREALPAFRTTVVTLIWDGAESRYPLAGQLGELVNPPSNNAAWQLVGFDVADVFLLSALSNCGFLPGYDDADALRKQWAPHLNEFHLFSQPETASAFRRASDVRLGDDHAPTFVYGIHILKLED